MQIRYLMQAIIYLIYLNKISDMLYKISYIGHKISYLY